MVVVFDVIGVEVLCVDIKVIGISFVVNFGKSFICWGWIYVYIKVGIVIVIKVLDM